MSKKDNSNSTSPNKNDIFASTTRTNPVGKNTTSPTKKKNSKYIQLLDITDFDTFHDFDKIDLSVLDVMSDNIYSITELKKVASELEIAPPKNKTWSKSEYINAISEKLHELQNKAASNKEEIIKKKPASKKKIVSDSSSEEEDESENEE